MKEGEAVSFDKVLLLDVDGDERRSLLDYLIRKDINRYRAIIAKKELGIRK